MILYFSVFQDKGAVYECECPLGFHGLHCESSAKSCSELPCQNGATCLSYADSYKCVCLAGYTGVNCEREIDECSSQPCLNGNQVFSILLILNAEEGHVMIERCPMI